MSWVFCAALLAGQGFGNDWPQWRGPSRDGVWHEPAFPGRLPDNPQPDWKAPVGGGYGGIAVADGRVFLLDRVKSPEQERLLAFDALSGKTLWVHSYAAPYNKLDYGNGPRTTPAIHQGKVYTFGAVGDIHCLDAATGKVHWHRHAVKDFQGKYPEWGYSSSPLIDESRLLLQIGGAKGCFIALDRESGKEIWRTCADRPGYSSARLEKVNGKFQIAWWSAEHALGLDRATGAILWQSPVSMNYDVAIADLVAEDGVFLASDYWSGTKAIRLQNQKAQVAWEGKQLNMLMCSPLGRDGYFYALDRFRGIKCLEAKSGKVMWENESATVRGQNPQASLVWVGKQALIFNEKGELVLAEMSPKEFKALGRVRLCDFTWAHPAFASGRVFARTEKELVSVRLVPLTGNRN